MENSHYWTGGDVKDKAKMITINFLNKDYEFHSNSGVFSKEHFDEGSALLLKTALNDGVNGKVLDLGCGYGAIGILLALNIDSDITMCDINPRAVELSRKNVKKFRLEDRVKVVQSDITKSIYEKFDTIITNPPIRVGNLILFNFFQESCEKLQENGVFFAVLRKKQGAERYTRKIEDIFGNAEVIEKKHGYWIVKAVKR